MTFFPSNSLTRPASSGEPGAGYSTSNNSFGNPPKSCIVRGRSIAVTATAGIYQWAETQSIALGFGTARPISAHASVHGFWNRAFIGFPCPKNIAGIVSDMVLLCHDAPACGLVY